MNLSREHLDDAAREGILSDEQARDLWAFLDARQKDAPRFDLTHVAYYFGASTVIAAMTWFAVEAWDSVGGGGLLVLATAYAAIFATAGHVLWSRLALRVPGGLLFTIAVCMAPLAVFGLERLAGLWPETASSADVQMRVNWMLMEAGTVLAGLLALRFVRFPFLTAPIAGALWLMSMHLGPLLFGRNEFAGDEHLWVSLLFGLAVLLIALVVDRKTAASEDYAFWLYLFGLLAFWGGLTLMDSSSEWSRLLYCLINVGLILVSLLLDRRVFIVFGALGVFLYFGHLAHEVFEDSLLFPIALSAVGAGMIYGGILLQRHRQHLESMLRHTAPTHVHRLLHGRRSRDA